MSVDGLQTLPPGVAEATALIERFDDCLLHGLTRLGPQNRDALDALSATFAGSPLAQKITDAVAAVGRSEFVITHVLALASARLALQGAQYDALVAQARDVFGLVSPDVEERPALSPGGASALLSSTQQWLMEIVLTGFQHLQEEAVALFAATLEHLQGDPEWTELSALLTGFVNELLAHMPAERHESLPIFRWADLWTGAMIRTQQLPGEPTVQPVSGMLTPLGLDLQSHANFVCAVLYGVFDGENRTQTVRVPLVSYKVEVVAGAEIWDLFGDKAAPLLQALEAHKTLVVQDAELLASGDLILKTPPTLGAAADPFAATVNLTALPALPALFRHPVHIAEVVPVSGDTALPLALERLPTDTELNAQTLKDACAMVGLLRFDQGGWRVQPLCVRSKEADVLSGEGIAKGRAKLKSKTLAVLRERAGKLLREARA